MKEGGKMSGDVGELKACESAPMAEAGVRLVLVHATTCTRHSQLGRGRRPRGSIHVLLSIWTARIIARDCVPETLGILPLPSLARDCISTSLWIRQGLAPRHSGFSCFFSTLPRTSRASHTLSKMADNTVSSAPDQHGFKRFTSAFNGRLLYSCSLIALSQVNFGMDQGTFTGTQVRSLTGPSC